MDPFDEFPYLPEGFLDKLGYWGDRRFVAVFWSQGRDRTTFDDGEGRIGGLLMDQVYLDLVRDYVVDSWLLHHQFDLGGGGEFTEHHWLVIDQEAEKAYVIRRDVAEKVVEQQRLEVE